MINTISIEGVKALPLFMESSRHLQQMKFKQAQNGFKLLLDRLNTDNYGLPSYTYVLRRYAMAQLKDGDHVSAERQLQKTVDFCKNKNIYLASMRLKVETDLLLHRLNYGELDKIGESVKCISESGDLGRVDHEQVAYTNFALSTAMFLAHRTPYSKCARMMKGVLNLSEENELKGMALHNLAFINYFHINEHNERLRRIADIKTAPNKQVTQERVAAELAAATEKQEWDSDMLDSSGRYKTDEEVRYKLYERDLKAKYEAELKKVRLSTLVHSDKKRDRKLKIYGEQMVMKQMQRELGKQKQKSLQMKRERLEKLEARRREDALWESEYGDMGVLDIYQFMLSEDGNQTALDAILRQDVDTYDSQQFLQVFSVLYLSLLMSERLSSQLRYEVYAQHLEEFKLTGIMPNGMQNPQVLPQKIRTLREFHTKDCKQTLLTNVHSAKTCCFLGQLMLENTNTYKFADYWVEYAMELYGAHMLKNEIKHPLALMAASLMDQGLSAKALDIVDTLLKEPFQLKETQTEIMLKTLKGLILKEDERTKGEGLMYIEEAKEIKKKLGLYPSKMINLHAPMWQLHENI